MKIPSASRLENFCLKELSLIGALDGLRETRARPAIGTPAIAKAIIYGPLFGFDSLMTVDLFTHRSAAKKLGLTQLSDSLIQKASPGVLLEPLNERLKLFYIEAKKRDLFKIRLTNPHRPYVSVFHEDGTHWMTHDWVFLTASGAVDQVIKLRWMKNIGEELKESQQMTYEAIRELGVGFCDIITYDGKHVDYPFLRELPKYKIDYFVRIRGNDKRKLKIVKQIEEHIATEQGVSTWEGIDIDNNCKVKVWRIEGIKDKRLGHDILGMKIELEYFKGQRAGQKEHHYAFTSAVYLNAEDLFIVRKSHWGIEILFRTLKAEYWSVHSYMKESHEAQVLATLVSISLNLYMLYRWYEAMDRDEDEERPITIKMVRLLLFESLILWSAGVENLN